MRPPWGLLLAPALTAAAALIFPRLALAEGDAAALHYAGGTLTALTALVAAARFTFQVGDPPEAARRSLRAALALAVAGAALVGVVAVVAPTPLLGVVLVNLGLVAVAHAGGGAIGVRVAHPGHLLPSCAVAAAADLASVLHPSGPSHAIAASERALSVLAVGFPYPGALPGAPVPPPIAPVLGVGDLVFLALVFGVAVRHRLSLARATAAGVAGLALAGAFAALAHREIPALVPIGAAVVAALPEARRLRPEDRRTAAVAVTMAVAVVVGVLLSPR